MRAYWAQGLSPSEATEKAKARRRRPANLGADSKPAKVPS
jgi:hypothetical protein